MKVCLLLSGQLRNAKETYPHFKKNLLDKYDVDVYISTWQSEHIQQIIELYKPVSVDIENYEFGFEEKWDTITKDEIHKLEKNSNLVSCISMWYKTMKVNRIRNDYQKLMGIQYDVVIKTRPDIKLEEPLELSQFNQNTLYVPYGWDWFYGINDLMAWGDESIMNSYCNLFYEFSNLVSRLDRINPERLLKEYIKNNSDIIKVTREYVDITLRDINIKQTYSFSTKSKTMYNDYNRIHIDVGANEGNTILHFAKHEPNTLVIGFEPIPQLVKNIKNQSSHLKNLIIVESAVSDYVGVTKFNVSPESEYGDHSCSSLLNFSDKSKTEWVDRNDFVVINEIDVNVTTLKHFIVKNEIPKIDYLKIDTQGCDLKVLMGLEDLISIVVEGNMEAAAKTDVLYEGQNTQEQSIEFLEKNGFEITKIESNDTDGNEVNIHYRNKHPKTLQFDRVYNLI
jgi:FkbM family methyltransferase